MSKRKACDSGSNPRSVKIAKIDHKSIIFHSKAVSKTWLLDWKDLSNFSNHTSMGKKSAEHAFQFQKAANADGKVEDIEALCTLIEAAETPQEAKSLGSKSSFKKHHLSLNVAVWNAKRDEIMEAIIRSKFENCPKLRAKVDFALKSGYQLFHFSRSDRYWGCHVDKETGILVRGENKLGLCITNVMKNWK